jgi:MATE family multidrug resistance protein
MNNVEDCNTEVVAIAGQLLVVRQFSNFRRDTGSFLRSVKGTARRIPMYITFVAYWVVGFPISIYFILN